MQARVRGTAGGRLARRMGTGLVAAALVTAAAATPAVAGGSGGRTADDEVRVVAQGLDGPRQVSAWRGKQLLVAESDSGEVSSIDTRTGRTRVVLDGLVTPQGVVGARGKIYVATGEAEIDPETGETTSGLWVARPGDEPQRFADLTGYELEHNPDGQTQYGEDGQPLDALSNPYAVIEDRHGFLLVADAGANAVLRVDARGRVSTFYVPPTVTTGPCAEVPNNNDTGFGCDSVPTGLAYGPDGLLYISALTAEVPGEGRVWVVDRKGKLVRTITGFTGPTGVAVGDDGTVHVAELFEGAPQGEPGPEFDPSEMGQVVSVSPSGERTTTQVTMPTGLLVERGRLYAAAWSIAAFLGRPGVGQVVVTGA